MIKIILIVALVTLIPFTLCRESALLDERKELSFSQLGFSSSMVKTLINSERGNVIFSPYSTYRVLLLLFFGANGDTEQSLRTTMNLNWVQSKDSLQQLYLKENQALENRLLKQENGFGSVDKLYVETGTELL